MPRTITSIDDCKKNASLLLKDLRSEEPSIARTAAVRFQRIKPFSTMALTALLDSRETIQHKHALEVIAREHGFISWKKLKDAADVLWYPRPSPFLNVWISTYAEAKAYHEEHGGYLLTHQGNYFICEAAYIESLGLDPKDSRWEAIDYDVKQPKDTAAYQELVQLAQAQIQQL